MSWKGLLLGVVWAVGVMACRSSAPVFHGTPLDPPLPLPAFSLVDQEGRPFTLEDLKGKPGLLFFGYTRCPDVCPLTLALWVKVVEELGPDAGRVRFLMVTVDPEWDTPGRLREYLARFSPLFTGLTGEPSALEGLYRALGIHMEKGHVEKGEEALVHTDRTFLLDGEGRVRAIYPFGTEPSALARDLRLLLGR